MSFKEGNAGSEVTCFRREVYPGSDLVEFSSSWGKEDDFEWSLPLWG